MVLADAVALVKLKTDAASDPVIPDANIELLLTTECKLEDDDGLAPDHDDWAGKYDLNLAEALVFEIKASKVATHFDFSSDGSRFNRQQKVEAFNELAKKARARRNCSFGQMAPVVETEVIVEDA